MVMDEVAFNHRYHIAHLLGTQFDKRMWDIYSGMNNNERPPFLEDVFTESAQAQALIILEELRNDDKINDVLEFDFLYGGVWNNDEHAVREVMDVYASECSYQDIFNDIFSYLSSNRLSFLVGNGDNRKEYASLVNSPVIQTW
jgi:hypothetical protein